MGWSGLPDDHHERGDLADLTPDGDRLFTLLIAFTNTPQRKGRFSRLEAAALARSRKFPIDLDVALPDLLDPEHPQIEEVDGGYQIINSEQYHVTPQKSVSGKKGGDAAVASGAATENLEKAVASKQTPSTLQAGSKHSEDGSKLSPSPSPKVLTDLLRKSPLSASAKDGAVERVFSTWQEQRRPGAKLTPERRRVIKAGLKYYSEEDLIDALAGVALDPYFMGQNDQGKVYDDLGLILRDAAHIEKFVALARGETPTLPTNEVDRRVLALLKSAAEGENTLLANHLPRLPVGDANKGELT